MMKQNKREEHEIVIFEPGDCLLSVVRKLLGDGYPIAHVRDAAAFEAVVQRDAQHIALIIASDQTAPYDTLEVLEAYQNERWFVHALSLIVARDGHPAREEKAERIGIQDYISFAAVSPTDCEKTLKSFLSHELRLLRKIRRLKESAKCDGLTGLYNQAAAADIVTSMLEDHPEQEFLFAIIDIDYFKQVNDERGHEFGDRVLKQESERIREMAGARSVAIRYGGDEFMLLVPIDSDPTSIARLLYRKMHFMLEDYPITGSIGISTTVSAGREWEFLYRQADQALYVAKANGRNQYCIFTKDMSYQLDGVGKDIRNETLNLGTGPLIHALVNGYAMVCHLDLDKVAVTRLAKLASGEYGWSDPIEYIPFISQLSELVKDEDKLRFCEFINPNTLSSRLKAASPLTYCFDGADERQYRVKYMAGDEAQSGCIANALMLLSEIKSSENANAVLQAEDTAIEKCLASSLTDIYNAIWIIHPATLSRDLVSIQTDLSRHRRINRLFEGGNYWEDTQGYFRLYVREEEREGLLKALHPDVLLREVHENGLYTVPFRRTIDGVTHRCAYTFTGALYGDEKVILQLYRRLTPDESL